MAEPPHQVKELIDRFDQNFEAYRSPGYNETQVRLEFINPFFEALGWDVTNKHGYAEPYKDVIHEDAIKVGGATKAPDYSFRVGGAKKFFLEAKKPSVNLKEDASPAYQLRRYAWSAKLPLSVLTNFAEFAVYDCRLPPKESDKASVGRILYFTYKDYAVHWGEIAERFSKEAVLQGSFDKFAEAGKGKKGTSQVDEEFLTEIEGWRDALARNLALRNPKLTVRDLNFAVQRTIDRIIFLRMCEDRGIEQYGQLQALLNGENTYKRLQYHYGLADDRYNSGLFHFRPEKGRAEAPDELTLKLKIDDKVLKDIIRRLYYPDSPYEFSVLGADILGNVYEQFLGKVIRLTAGHRAVVEEKPEVKKAGGVYYTPAYIVDYIVKNTVGKLCEGKSPKQIEKLKILDPACGSGSFLIGAYTYLLNYHRDWYVKDGLQKHTKEIYQGSGGQWLLTTQERKRVLLDNIYGVDIDSQAVEVTKLSLLLKVLEGESEETIGKNLKLFRERALPDLGSNIKCGNSLIGPDFYQHKQMSLLDDEERYRINVFDWHSEFPAIMKVGGFDAVIGNPPYVLLQDEFRDDAQLAYFRSKYTVASYKIDMYHLFIERGISATVPGGRCAMITPANFLTNNYLAPLRRLLLKDSSIDHILLIDGGVFQGVSVDNAVFVVTRGKPTLGSFQIIHAARDGSSFRETSKIPVSTEQALSDEYVLFAGAPDKKTGDLWRRVMGKSQLLGRIAHVNFGKQLRDRKKYTKDVISVSSISKVSRRYRPCYTGRDVSRYFLSWNNLACLNDDEARCGGCWDADKQDAKNKLVTRQIGRYPEFAIDPFGYQCLNTMFMVKVNVENTHPKFVLGILNSSLLRAFWLNHFYDQRRTFPKIKGTYLKQLPLFKLDFSDPKQKVNHDRIVALVDRVLDLHKRLAAAKNPNDKTRLQREIEATDRQIDQFVYELYGLTEEEIKIVEEAT